MNFLLKHRQLFKFLTTIQGQTGQPLWHNPYLTALLLKHHAQFKQPPTAPTGGHRTNCFKIYNGTQSTDFSHGMEITQVQTSVKKKKLI